MCVFVCFQANSTATATATATTATAAAAAATTHYYHCYTGYDPVGWGLPYGSFVATDTAKPLMESAVQVRTLRCCRGRSISMSDI